jgi:hypothetical protein
MPAGRARADRLADEHRAIHEDGLGCDQRDPDAVAGHITEADQGFDRGDAVTHDHSSPGARCDR